MSNAPAAERVPEAVPLQGPALLADAAPLTDAVSDPERIAPIDAARGLAILGILLVNIQFFAHPFGEFLTMSPPAGSGALDRAVFYFTAIFCSGKFYPLFSMLFGIGFVIQLDRARGAGRPFAGMYLRRLAALMVLGLMHGLLLWYGDILFLYSVCGLVLFGALMIFPDAGWRGLVIAGMGIVLLALLLSTAVGLLTLLGAGEGGQAGHDPEAIAWAQSEADAARSPLSRLGEGFQEGEFEEGPADPLWVALEERAYREGPYLQALGFRAMTFGFSLIFMLFGFGWHVLGMFFIGAGLMRAGFFLPQRRPLHRRLLLLGLLAGLPLSIAAAALPGASDSAVVTAISPALNMIGGPMMSLAYLSGLTLLVNAGRALGATRLIGSVGRMAMTCYLLSTVLATFIMYHWGLGMFGRVPHSGLLLIVLGIYLLLVVLANVWLAFFRFGPMEWLWRSVTYLRFPPLVRRST